MGHASWLILAPLEETRCGAPRAETARGTELSLGSRPVPEPARRHTPSHPLVLPAPFVNRNYFTPASTFAYLLGSGLHELHKGCLPGWNSDDRLVLFEMEFA